MNTYNVELISQPLKITTEHNLEAFQTLNLEVEKKLQEVKNSNNNISTEKALLLTCFHLAEDKFLLKKAIDKNINSLESQAKSLLEDLESSPKGLSLKIKS